ncbi:MAG: hypothetical protein AAFR21_10910 [Pseudomonadota bacterium]
MDRLSLNLDPLWRFLASMKPRPHSYQRRANAQRRTNVRLGAYTDSNRDAPSLMLTVGRKGVVGHLTDFAQRSLSTSRVAVIILVTASVFGLSFANEAGWVSVDNPIVAAGVFLRNGLIFNLGAWQTWVVFAFFPLLWRILPDGWRLVVFPFAAQLMFLQISHWALAIFNAATSKTFGAMFSLVKAIKL